MTKGIVINPGAHNNTFGTVVIDGADVGIDNKGDKNTFGTVIASNCETAVSVEGSGNEFQNVIIAEDSLREALSELPNNVREMLAMQLARSSTVGEREAALSAHPGLWDRVKSLLEVGGNLSSIAQFVVQCVRGGG
jgi:hypothetical protein